MMALEPHSRSHIETCPVSTDRLAPLNGHWSVFKTIVPLRSYACYELRSLIVRQDESDEWQREILKGSILGVKDNKG
jgi:hypothetical protein